MKPGTRREGHLLILRPRQSRESSVVGDPTKVARVIALAKEGDSHAFGSLLEGYRAYLSMLARVQIGRRLRSKLDDDDLLQEAFLRAHRAIGRFRGTTGEELLAWLRGILAHVLADQIRRYHGTEQRDPKLERALEFEFERSSERFRPRAGGADEQSEPASSPSRAGGAARRGDGAASRLRSRGLVLRHFEDLSFPEVANRMGRTLDGVKNLWIRALARLRREVDFLDELD